MPSGNGAGNLQAEEVREEGSVGIGEPHASLDDEAVLVRSVESTSHSTLADASGALNNRPQ